ncbi:MAG TPA: hypothetical protein VKM55_17155 [Candidatus Lokiarchaeia archaeon]|nr:hypothetical protein [Candidatus Lokiarchaeia archaeon]
MSAKLFFLCIQKIDLITEDRGHIASNPHAGNEELEWSECHAPVPAAPRLCPGCGSTLQ